MKKLILIGIMSLLAVLPVSGDAEGRISDARSYWLYEMGTQQVLAEYRADMETPAASLTKLMTCLLTLEAVDEGVLKWDEAIRTPMDYVNPGGSTMGLKAGQTVSVSQLVDGLMIVSANDGAQVLANRIGGDERQFVGLMNKRAGELGLSHTRFLNANGLPTEKGQNRTSAGDIGRLSEYMIRTYSQRLLSITSRSDFTLPSGIVTLPNTNTLRAVKSEVDGLKTGHTDDAGYCLAATMPFRGRSDTRLIAVVMGTASERDRDRAAKKLLDWAEEHYDYVTVIDEKKIIGAGNWQGLDSRPLSAHPKNSVQRFLRKGTPLETMLTFEIPEQLPIHKGDVIGSMDVTLSGGEQLTVPLLSDTDIVSITLRERILLVMNSVIEWWRSVMTA